MNERGKGGRDIDLVVIGDCNPDVLVLGDDVTPSFGQQEKLVEGIWMVVGGSAAPESLIRGFDKHGLRLLHAWGMTEMSPLGSCSWLKAGMLELEMDGQTPKAWKYIPPPQVQKPASAAA